MNKIYLFAIASILATASLMAGTFTFTAMAQAPTTPSGDASQQQTLQPQIQQALVETQLVPANSTAPY